VTTPRATSWSGTVTYHFAAEHRPSDLDALRTLVSGSRALRPVGTAHTFSDLPDGAEAVSLAAFDTVEVAEDRTSVRVGAGMTHATLAEALAPHGLALENLASLPHLNVVGAVATATHGSGVRTRNLATQVRALELVLASGDLLTLRRGDDDLAGAVVGLGLLGVVHHVELDVVPAVPHRQLVLHDADVEGLPDRLHALLDLGRSVSVFTRWDGTPHRVWVKWRDDDPAPDPHPLGLRVADQPEHPIAGLDTIHCTLQGGVPGPWVERLPHFRPGYLPSVGDEVQSEYHLPREHGPAAARALADVGHLLDAALLTSEIRAVAADDLWLSPQSGQDTCSFHFTWTSDTTLASAAALVVEEALAPFSPRPHWGKHFNLDVRDAYPRLPDFLALRERLDPDRTFVGPWAERVLGI
jgi:xylitol oxidase